MAHIHNALRFLALILAVSSCTSEGGTRNLAVTSQNVPPPCMPSATPRPAQEGASRPPVVTPTPILPTPAPAVAPPTDTTEPSTPGLEGGDSSKDNVSDGNKSLGAGIITSIAMGSAILVAAVLFLRRKVAESSLFVAYVEQPSEFIGTDSA